ncbi:hypothetical protein [Kitasatospora sp. NPDC089509]|uniref:hypothetical protein n=1 Tax=Kitasatospora sp. NPDC089509 TaxID=3364079 RepID=UPI003830EF97
MLKRIAVGAAAAALLALGSGQAFADTSWGDVAPQHATPATTAWGDDAPADTSWGGVAPQQATPATTAWGDVTPANTSWGWGTPAGQ